MPYIKINKDLCKGCRLCVSACPHNLIAMSFDFNKKGVHYAIYQKTEKCTGCTLCAVMCPDVAICVFKEKLKV